MQGVQCIAYGPLGHSDRTVLNNKVLQQVAKDLGRTPAQVSILSPIAHCIRVMCVHMQNVLFRHRDCTVVSKDMLSKKLKSCTTRTLICGCCCAVLCYHAAYVNLPQHAVASNQHLPLNLLYSCIPLSHAAGLV